jgi:hypothetical protein
MKRGRALLLVGSPRGAHSTSEALGSYLLGRLAAAEMETALLHIGAGREAQAHGPLLARAVNEADLLLLSFPLYVDCLPAGLLSNLEDLASYRQQCPSKSRQRLAAIVNCGFPESAQAMTALAICQQFALEAGFDWAGGLALGAGPAIKGRPLQRAGSAGLRAMPILDAAAAALVAGADIPAPAAEGGNDLLLPKSLCLWLGTIDFKIKARAEGAHKRLYDQPYRCANRQ